MKTQLWVLVTLLCVAHATHSPTHDDSVNAHLDADPVTNAMMLEAIEIGENAEFDSMYFDGLQSHVPDLSAGDLQNALKAIDGKFHNTKATSNVDTAMKAAIAGEDFANAFLEMQQSIEPLSDAAEAEEEVQDELLEPTLAEMQQSTQSGDVFYDQVMEADVARLSDADIENGVAEIAKHMK